jgi:hypothetical protein
MLALEAFGIAPASAFQTAKTEAQTTPPFRDPHFIIVYDDDPGLCKPLAKLYEDDLRKDMSSPNLPPPLLESNNDSLPEPITDYEQRDVKGFEALGLHPLMLSSDLDVPDVYKINILHDKNIYEVRRIETAFYRDMLYTLAVFHDDSEVFPVDGANEELIHWPGFDEMKRKQMKGARKHPLSLSMTRYPRVDSLFQYKGRYLFISNMYMHLPEPTNGQGIIRVFELIDMRFIPRDLCYIAPAPSALLTATTGDPYGHVHP